MLIPYKTDAHDGIFRLIAPGIMVLCTIIQVFVSRDDNRINEELNALGAKIKEQFYKTANSTAKRDFSRSLQWGMMKQNLRSVTNLQWCMIVDSLDIDDKAEMIAERNGIINSQLIRKLAFIPSEFSIVKLFTSMFTHANWTHLVGNMLFFYLCGITLERYWGGAKFLALYLLFGVVASLSNMAWDAAFHKNLAVPLIGASGAIAGIMGAFWVTHGKTKVHLLFIFFFWPRFYKIPAWIYMIFWFSTQVMYMLFFAKINVGVAFCAHVAGFLTGVLAGFIVKSEDQAAVVTHNPRTSIRKPIPIPGKTVTPTSGIPHNHALPNAPERHVVQQPLEQGWRAFEQNDSMDAAQKIAAAINNLFKYKPPDLDLIRRHLTRIFKENERLPIHPNQFYEWAGMLLQLHDSIYSLQCFDLAANTSRNLHIKTHSLFQAAMLRITLGQQIEKAQTDLLYLLKIAPQSPIAWQTKKLLIECHGISSRRSSLPPPHYSG